MWAFMRSSRSPAPVTFLFLAASSAISEDWGTDERLPLFQLS